MFGRVQAVVADALGAVFPVPCVGCGRGADPLCGGCTARLSSAPVVPAPPGIDWWVACFAYEGAAREAIARAKYRNARSAFPALAAHLAACVAGRLAAGAHGSTAVRVPDVVTWAPASAARVRRTGVDHAEFLAHAVAARLGLPARRLLVRLDAGAQTGAAARARRLGPRVHALPLTAGCAVLVVDDVATTGGTLTAAARALRDRGARHVVAATLARTPPRSGGGSRGPIIGAPIDAGSPTG